MALPPKDNEAFYREVDEELRRDQIRTLFSRYGLLAALAVVLLLGSLGGYFWWQHYRQSRAEEQAETLSAIYTDITAGKAKEVGPRLEKLAEEGNEGYRMVAQLTTAALAAEQTEKEAAVAAYKRIAADEDAAEPFRNLALVRQTALEFDALVPAVVIERLKPLATEGNPWFASAGEMVALAYMKQQKPELAAPIFAAIAKDVGAPPGVARRALQMAQSLGMDIEEPGAAAATGATKE